MALSKLAETLVRHPVMARKLPGFDPEAAPAAPGPLFVEWLLAAVGAGVPDAQVVTLSTVDPEGLPDARVLVLRDVDAEEAGFVFWTEASRPKAHQLAERPVAAMTVYWPALGRQVRIRGTVETTGQLAARPETVYTLRARSVEFWQGDAGGRHIRIRYDRDPRSGAWHRERLEP